MDGHEHPRGAVAAPPPSPPPRQCHVGFTMIPNGAGLEDEMARNTDDGRTDGASTNNVPWPPHHTLGPGPRGASRHPSPICPGKG